jgi:hypothetical protein
MNNFFDDVNLTGMVSNDLDLVPTLFSFFLCLVMAFVVRAFYTGRAFSLTGKSHIAAILPLLSAVIFLIIVVVKSSLALSLGLVGALSVVRFRTPIKEPEDLVYLFLAIALGIGYGANQILITTIISAIILTIAYFWLSNRKTGITSEYNLVVSWESPTVGTKEVSEQIACIADSASLIRYDNAPGSNTAVYVIQPKEGSDLDDALSKLRALDKTASASFFEARTNY